MLAYECKSLRFKTRVLLTANFHCRGASNKDAVNAAIQALGAELQPVTTAVKTSTQATTKSVRLSPAPSPTVTQTGAQNQQQVSTYSKHAGTEGALTYTHTQKHTRTHAPTYVHTQRPLCSECVLFIYLHASLSV